MSNQLPCRKQNQRGSEGNENFLKSARLTHRSKHTSRAMESAADAAERRHFHEVLHSFRDYAAWVGLEVRRREAHLARLPPRYLDRLPSGSQEAKLAALRNAVALNQALLDAICDAQIESGFGGSFSAGAATDAIASTGTRPTSSEAHFSKARSTLHQFARDWSAEGAPERESSYGVLLKLLKEALPVTPANANQQRVLIPGCGLGRLVFDAAAARYAAQGNEFSLQMLFASHYILNCLPEAEEGGAADGQVHLCPWIHDPSNHLRPEDMMRVVSVPDVLPASLLTTNTGADMSMTAGDFVEIYGTPEHVGAWDAVLTCFFLDTAPIAFEYIDVIHRVLRPGGVWLNCGPLQFHWAGPSPEGEADSSSSSSSSGEGEHPHSHGAVASVSGGAHQCRSSEGGGGHHHHHSSHQHDHPHPHPLPHPQHQHQHQPPHPASEEAHGPNDSAPVSSASTAACLPASSPSLPPPPAAAAPPRVDDRYARAVEFTYSELRHAIIASGFTMAREGTGRTTYAANSRGLARTLYTTLNFVAVKGSGGGDHAE